VSTALNVAFVLDMSGSMGYIREAAVEGANQYVRDLQKDEEANTTRLTFICFDTEYEVWYENQPVTEIEFIGDRYQPRGGTALYDAIAKTIARLDAAKRGDEKHLIVILTDGHENSSVEYAVREGGRERLAALIQTYEDKGNWTFVYLGANDHNVQATAAAINIPVGNAAFYSASTTSAPVAMAAASNVTLTRKYSGQTASSNSFTDSGIETLEGGTADFRDEEEKS
jgi:uncharacterized protein YegL